MASLQHLRASASAYTFARDELPPKKQATRLRRAAEHLRKARLAVTGEPSGSVVREGNSTLLDAALQGEDVDADQVRRDLLASNASFEQVLRRAAEMATALPWTIRVRTTAWPFGLMEQLFHIWTVILGQRAGGSELGLFAKVCRSQPGAARFPQIHAFGVGDPR